MSAPPTAARAVLLAGATGLVGREALGLFLEAPDFGPVTALVRRPIVPAPTSPRYAEVLADFERLDAAIPTGPADVAVCCLGTTIKVAGSQERFRAVDHGYPLAFAQAALARGARHYLLVSAIGASARSSLFYSRVKGELEEALAALPFRSLGIVRPALLLGPREEFRLGEVLATPFARLVPGRWRPVHARDVAAALVRLAREDVPGKRVLESEEIRRWARAGA